MIGRMKESVLFSNCIFLICLVSAQNFRGDDCEMESGDTGKCIPLNDCPSAIADLQNGLYPDTCGFEGRTALVCCPTSSELTETISEQKCRNYASFVPGFEVLAIVGGTDTLPREFPHMAALGYANGNEKIWRCGGSLVSEQYVLTAAHCLRSAEFGDVQWVRLGDLNLVSTTDVASPQDFRITRRIPHPSFKSPSAYNDIALVQLERPVRPNSFIRPACLYQIHNIPFTTELIATGWGLVEFGGNSSDTLQKVTLDLFGAQECNATYSNMINTRKLRNGIQDELQFCAGGRNRVVDTCQGDSGGPVETYRRNERIWSIVGVTSFGKACGAANIPGVYTRVSNYLPWLESILWPNN